MLVALMELKKEKKELSDSILLTKIDQQAVQVLFKINANLVHQVVPTDKAEDFEKLLKEQ